MLPSLSRICTLPGLGHHQQAIPIDQTITKNDAEIGGGPGVDNPIPDHTIPFTVLNPNATSAVMITFSVRGDFSAGG